MSKPWEIQSSERNRESSKAYFAFCLYRDMPPDQRSLAQVTAILKERRGAPEGSRLSDTTSAAQESRGKRPSRQVADWARSWRWVERASAWDSEQQRIQSETRLAEVEEMTKRHAVQSKVALQAAMVPSAAIARKLRDDPRAERELAALPAAELLRLAAVMRFVPALQTAERQARGVYAPARAMRSVDGNAPAAPRLEITGAEFAWVEGKCVCGHAYSVHDQEHENPARMPCTIDGCACERYADADDPEAYGVPRSQQRV